MPELAEVETARRYSDRALRGHVLREVEFDPSDRIFFEHCAGADVERALVGARVTGTGRRGKYFWFELNRRPWPVFHLGMSGGVSLLGPTAERGVWDGVRLWSRGDGDPKDRLAFARLVVRAGAGVEFVLRDPRRFGRMWLSDDPLRMDRIAALGFDPLLGCPRATALAKTLGTRRRAIKTVLLDQTLFAGVGNYLADEILFQARIKPSRRAADLSTAEVARLRRAIVGVVKKATDLDADYERFPKSWLFHHRWGKDALARTAAGQKVVHETIGGRTTAWVPGRQV